MIKYYPMPNTRNNFETQAIILAKGDFPNHPIPLGILHAHQSDIICCDGAANDLLKQNITPQAIIGDCDSISNENNTQYAHLITKISEQNTNDLTKAVSFCEKQSIKSVVILGATGKREDHTLANIGLLTRFVHMVENVSMITDYGIFNVIKEPSIFESWPGQQVSLFPFSSTPITTDNLKYPLDQQSLDYWWQGTLNESFNDNFMIDVENTCIIYRVFQD